MCLTPTQRSDIFRNVAYSLPTISHTPSFRPSLIPCPYSSHFAIAVVCTNKMLNCRKSRMNSLSLVESLCTHPIPHISLSGTLCMLLPPPFREKSLHAICSSPWHPAYAPVWPNEATIHIMKTIFQSLFLSSLSIYLTLFLLPPLCLSLSSPLVGGGLNKNTKNMFHFEQLKTKIKATYARTLSTMAIFSNTTLK